MDDVIKMTEYEIYRKMAINKGIRIDGRGITELRQINAEVFKSYKWHYLFN